MSGRRGGTLPGQCGAAGAARGAARAHQLLAQVLCVQQHLPQLQGAPAQLHRELVQVQLRAQQVLEVALERKLEQAPQRPVAGRLHLLDPARGLRPSRASSAERSPAAARPGPPVARPGQGARFAAAQRVERRRWAPLPVPPWRWEAVPQGALQACSPGSGPACAVRARRCDPTQLAQQRDGPRQNSRRGAQGHTHAPSSRAHTFGKGPVPPGLPPCSPARLQRGRRWPRPAGLA